jgi:type II restriction enzyme
VVVLTDSYDNLLHCHMNLACLTQIAAAYRAGPQIARAVTEEWCAREMYCPACGCDRLSPSRANTPAIDFSCTHCGQLYQLKSSKTWNAKKIVDAGYDAMIRAIRADRAPNLLVLNYSSDWFVANLLLVPRMFFTESIIERRKPLGIQARRSGWVGCNILLREIPEDGKIMVVSGGQVTPAERVRAEFARVRELSQLPPGLRGWVVDILRIIRRLGKTQFSLADIYQFEPELLALHPQNRHIRAKTRQQLQVLRDLGLLRFDAPGRYTIV